MKSDLVVLSGLLIRAPPPRPPVTSRGHDQCAEGRTASLRPHHFYLRIMPYTSMFQSVHPLERRNTRDPIGLSSVPTGLHGPTTRTRWILIPIYQCTKIRHLASAGLLRCRCFALASDRRIDDWARWGGRLSRLSLDARLHTVTQLDLCSVMLWGLLAHRSNKKKGFFAKLTSVTFEVGGSFGHLHGTWSPRASTKGEGKQTHCLLE